MRMTPVAARLRDELARARRVGLVEHGRLEIADVEVDCVAEQHQLHRRDADDHRERQPVAAQLPQLLDDDRAEPTQVHGPAPGPASLRVAATNTSSRFGAVGSTVAVAGLRRKRAR